MPCHSEKQMLYCGSQFGGTYQAKFGWSWWTWIVSWILDFDGWIGEVEDSNVIHERYVVYDEMCPMAMWCTVGDDVISATEVTTKWSTVDHSFPVVVDFVASLLTEVIIYSTAGQLCCPIWRQYTWTFLTQVAISKAKLMAVKQLKPYTKKYPNTVIPNNVQKS